MSVSRSVRDPRPVFRLLNVVALTVLILLGFATSASLDAQTADCGFEDVVMCRDTSTAGSVITMPIGANAEVEESVKAPSGPGFSITIDNSFFTGAPQAPVLQRDQDIALSDANVDVRFDGLTITPRLNVATSDLRTSATANTPVTFRASTNYPAYITRAEIRILDADRRRGEDVVARIPVAPNGTAEWAMPVGGSGDFSYVLRVYDAQGRYNETRAQNLRRTSEDQGEVPLTGPIIAAGEGEDLTATRQFKVRGGAVTIAADGLEPGQKVRVMDENIPVDASGAFVTERILPPGQNRISVEVSPGASTRGSNLTRDINIPESEVFYVAIADLTVSENKTTYGDGASETERRTDGRLAFYFKGKYPSGTSVTASLDTGDGLLSDAFSRLEDKDPVALLQRLRDDTFYPTYGDDSIAFDDTPTSGRFYLRLENDTSRLIVGDFDAGITGSTFLRDTRSLYGAQVVHQSMAAHADGTAVFRLEAFAAQGDTISRRDVLEGTGGSAYFLSHQDIEAGTETVSVEVYDPETGRVRSVQILTAGEDYSIDPIQGIIILTSPLTRSVSDGSLIQSGAGGDDVARLVVTYQQSPTFGSVDGNTFGARAEWSVTDRLTFGVSGSIDTTGVSDHEVIGVDVRQAIGAFSWVELEYARSEGPGFGSTFSNDGGLTIEEITSAGVVGRSAEAYRLDAHFALRDLGLENEGFLDVYAERIADGFSSQSLNLTDGHVLLGIEAEYAISDVARLRFDGETFRKNSGEDTTEVELTFATRRGAVAIDVGLAWLDQTRPDIPTETGSQTYLLARLSYAPKDDFKIYAFARQSVASSGLLAADNRYGVGTELQLNDRLRLAAEVSDGSQGFGASASLTWSPAPGREVYLRLADGADFADDGAVSGRDLVFGAKNRVSDRVSTFAETVYRDTARETSLSRVFGVTYTPVDLWTVSAQLEQGEVRDDVGGDFDRFAFSGSVSYDDGEEFSAFARLEYRYENGAGTARDRETWLLAAAFDYRTSPDWHVLGSLDLVHSDSDEGDFRDGNYTRVSLGYAYRPTENDRTNALLRLTYIDDQPGEDQVASDGSANGDRERNFVFSADVIHELGETLTIGAKYGYRRGEFAPRGTSDFTRNDAHLAVLRVDWDFTHNWSLALEARQQWNEPSGDSDTGGSIALYRDIGNNVMLGVGYEAGSVTSDLTNTSYDERGLFVNIIAKF